MYKVGVCGHFAYGDENFNSGQKDKTKSVYAALAKALGESNVATLDTRGWKKNPLKMLIQCKKLITKCENVIMLPATNGLKVFPLFFAILNTFYQRRLHYVVVGGWLARFIENKSFLMKLLKKLHGIYVEIPSMKSDLSAMGFNNVFVMPNFRETVILTPEELYFPDGEPYRVCTFSRICYSKGIEDAIEAVRYVNQSLGRVACTLDIYGLPDEDYKERFEELQKDFEDYITYKGYVSGTANSSSELRTCFAMLFPTWYAGEGFAGTVVDAFCTGVPIIATDWKYNKEVISHGKNGIIYSVNEREKLKEILLDAVQNPDKLNAMRADCLRHAQELSPQKGVQVILDQLK